MCVGVCGVPELGVIFICSAPKKAHTHYTYTHHCTHCTHCARVRAANQIQMVAQQVNLAFASPIQIVVALILIYKQISSTPSLSLISTPVDNTYTHTQSTCALFLTHRRPRTQRGAYLYRFVCVGVSCVCMHVCVRSRARACRCHVRGVWPGAVSRTRERNRIWTYVRLSPRHAQGIGWVRVRPCGRLSLCWCLHNGLFVCVERESRERERESFA